MLRRYLKKTYFLCSILMISMNISGQACETSNYTEAFQIYDGVIRSCPPIGQMHTVGVNRRKQEAAQLTTILDSIKTNQNMDHEALQKAVTLSLEQDISTFTQLNQQLTSYKAGVNGATYPLLTNKMSIILNAALELGKGKTFFDILEEKLPAGYSIDPPVFNYFPQDEHIYSNGIRGNGLKTLLLKILQIQNEQPLSGLNQLLGNSLEACPFLYIIPLPDGFDVSLLEKSPYFFSDSKTPQAIVVVHNGYNFGGNRDDKRGHQYPPHDCTSLLTQYTGSKPVSTLHFTQYYHDFYGLPFSGLSEEVVQKWNAGKIERKKDPFIQNIDSLFNPLPANPDPQTLTAGLVHVERTYNPAKLGDNLSGTGGHAGIFLGTDGVGPDIKALTLSANRDLEGSGKEFGYGVELRPYYNETARQVMLFDVKNKN